jgi:hypothetical protein
MEDEWHSFDELVDKLIEGYQKPEDLIGGKPASA